MKGVAKYLARYAEPEHLLAEAVVGHLTGGYRCVFVAPALDELPTFLDGYRAATRSAALLGQRVLGIVVVNAKESAGEARILANQILMEVLRSSAGRARRLETPPPVHAAAWLLEFDDFDTILIDRSSTGRRLPDQQGVGLARRIGCDLAVELHARGAIASPWLVNLDADTALPRDYFLRVAAYPSHDAARVSSFEHVASGDTVVDAHTRDYEASLRYVTLGLRWAGSPHAFHTIGSTLSMDINAYVAVRGFPKRAAAEDFYLLCKLAKVGRVRSLVGPRVQIRARPSDRAPFGTGPHVARLMLEPESVLRVYHPRSFRVLAVWLRWLGSFTRDAVPEPSELRALGQDWGLKAAELDALQTFLSASGFVDTVARLQQNHGTHASLDRAIHTWFDRFQTMRLLHHLRDHALPNVMWSRAVGEASFIPDELRAELKTGTENGVEALRCHEELYDFVGSGRAHAGWPR